MNMTDDELLMRIFDILDDRIEWAYQENIRGEYVRYRVMNRENQSGCATDLVAFIRSNFKENA